jgi:hypothetical protein
MPNLFYALSLTMWGNMCGALGGMGSLNDLVLCRQNHHKIEMDAEPSASVLLSFLIDICFETARTSKETAMPRIDKLEVVSGSRCRHCGHSFIGDQSFLRVIAVDRLRQILQENAVPEWPRKPLIDYWKSGYAPSDLKHLVDLCVASKIEHASGTDWMRPCRKCGSEDTCVYRWRITPGGLIPTTDNLSIRFTNAQ